MDGAIHRAGGPAILDECRRIVARQGPLPPGEAVITTAGRLPSRHVIHTVGPIWSGGKHGEAETLARCYRNSLRLARAHGLRSVAFPSISTGAFGYPVAEAARVAWLAVGEELEAAPVAWISCAGRSSATPTCAPTNPRRARPAPDPRPRCHVEPA